jgi:hypothetical protein
MTDFVTRLETELHKAALQRERSGRVRGVAFPRMRVALRDLPGAAVATVVLGLAVAGAALLLAAWPEPPISAGMPAELRGAWQAPPKELRLYPRGAERCANLGLGDSEPCYTLGESSNGVAHEWGRLSVAGEELTLTATQNARQNPTPGVYRWRVERGALRLTKVDDPVAARARALATTPLRPVRPSESRARLPVGWAATPYTSRRFGYSINMPAHWSVDAGGPTDRFAPHPWRGSRPAVSVVARDLPAGTPAARWTVIFDSRLESACAPHDFRRFVVDGTKIRVSVYRDCGDGNRQSASLVHDGRGYGVLWRGTARTPERDYARFDALLKSMSFSP